MTEELSTYDVKCRTCRSIFKTQLFESHEKNLFLVDNKNWYCEDCKKEYFKKQTENLEKAHQSIGFSELKGTQKQISWAEKIRSEMINKVDYLEKSLKFNTDDEKQLSEKAFDIFLKEWHGITQAKWWVENRRMTVRDISKRIQEISESIKKE